MSATKSKTKREIFALLKYVTTIQNVIVGAISGKAPKRVDASLADTLETTKAKEDAEKKMREKAGT